MISYSLLHQNFRTPFNVICAGHLCRKIGASLTSLGLNVSSGSYCTNAIAGPTVYGNTLATTFIHCPIERTM